MGIYKGLFTTQGTMERGTLEISITPNNYAVATLKLVSGQKVRFKASRMIEVGAEVQDLGFSSSSVMASFKLSVDLDGNNVQISDVMYKGITSGAIAAHETSRAPVVPITGVLSCDDCDAHPLLVTGDTGTFSLLYVGDGTDVHEITALVDVGVIVSSPGDQAGCAPIGSQMICDIFGGGTIGSNVMDWIGAHIYNTANDCSEASGDWTLVSANHGSFTGIFTSDTSCSAGPTVLIDEDFESFTGSGFAPSPAAGQLDSDIVIVTGLSDGSMAYGDTETTGDFARGTDADGGVSTGGTYNFTSGGNSFIGFQPAGSDFTPGTLEFKVQNTSGVALSSIDIAYDILANNDQSRANSLNGSFSTDGTTFTPIASLDFTSTEASDGLGFVTTARAATVTSTVNNGDFFYFRLSGNDETGGDQGMKWGLII